MLATGQLLANSIPLLTSIPGQHTFTTSSGCVPSLASVPAASPQTKHWNAVGGGGSWQQCGSSRICSGVCTVSGVTI